MRKPWLEAPPNAPLLLGGEEGGGTKSGDSKMKQHHTLKKTLNQVWGR